MLLPFSSVFGVELRFCDICDYNDGRFQMVFVIPLVNEATICFIVTLSRMDFCPNDVAHVKAIEVYRMATRALRLGAARELRGAFLVSPLWLPVFRENKCNLFDEIFTFSLVGRS